MKLNSILIYSFCCLLLSSCATDKKHVSPNAGRYQHNNDSAPQRLPTLLEMTDPEPKPEPLSRGGNQPYSVFGRNYSPQLHLTEYQESGIASWYGNKFHGYLTSNGETYNMFAMTAAHKTLPLPSYVRVTNLDNNKSAIVRVNDRGPFHRDRIIDLSYSAAHKLDMLQQGTARIQLELIKSPAMSSAGITATASCYIQIVASGDNNRLRTIQQQLRQQWQMPSEIQPANGMFRLLVGPTTDKQQAQSWLSRLKADNYPAAFFFDSQACS